jgi:DNA-binding CsgD family transcriptional regulator/tetratricopeptide (TPR) repeat protein
MLLERDAELVRLRTLLESARGGHGRVAFVGGEAGIGKSSLVSAFTRDLPGDTRVAYGRCDALMTPRALGPLLEIATDLGISGTDHRDGLLNALVADVRRNGTTVLVVEDAHWADDASIDLLVMLGRRAVDLPLLLIVTYRDDQVTGDHPLRVAVGDLITASTTVWLGLVPLTRTAVQQLAGRYDIHSDDLFERTGGNPFFVTEALASPGDDIPTSVRLAVLARAARLEPAQRSVLDAVSVVPGRAEAWLVAALCDQPASAVDACVAAGVLIADQHTYTFRHDLARLVVEADLDAAVRRDLNQRAVDVLRDRPDADPARLAHHAEAAGDDATLAKSALEAFMLATARTAYREAAHLGERALNVRHFLSGDDVAELQTNLAVSLTALARSDEAEDLANHAVEHWRTVGNDRRQAEALLVLSAAISSLGHTQQSMLPLAEAIDILEKDDSSPGLALAYIRLATAHMLAREHDPAIEWGERAIALATRHDDPSLLGRALIVTGIADVMDSRFEGLARVRKGIEIGRRHDLPAVVAQGFTQIGSGCGELRRYEEAVPALIEGSAISAQHSLETSRRYQVAWLARCRFDLGQWDEAELLARDAIVGSRIDVTARFVGLNTLGWLRARRGDPDVFPLLDEALDIARDTGHLQRLWPNAVARAEAGWLDGDLDPHVDLLEAVLELALQARHGLAIGEVALWLQRAGRLAIVPVDAAQPFAAWLVGEHMRATTEFRRMGCPYETASVLADTAEVPSLRVALATFRRLGAAPMIARVSTQLRALGVRVPPKSNGSPAALRHPSGLTDRELEVLKLVAGGFTNPQIAGSLYISRKTAEHHVSNILMKLGTTTRSEAAAAAIRLGLAG